MGNKTVSNRNVSELHRFVPGRSVLADIDPASTPGVSDKDQARADLAELGPLMSDLQERLYAEATGGSRRRVVLMLQGMDTSGKDGTVRHVVGLVNPQGVNIHSFKAPTKEELAHDFLWRIEKAVPDPGIVGIFNRSQYEDVLIVRVHNIVPESEWSTRYERINEFEKRMSDDGVHWVKVMLHISKDAQKQRLLERLDDPTKHWKYSAGDLRERAFWADYQSAYQAALEQCSTDTAPWYVVPADNKWYRNWAIGHLLTETLQSMGPQFPPADFNVGEQRRLVEAAD